MTNDWVPVMNLEHTLTTVLAAAVGAYLAARLGFTYALSKLKHERAFDRRLVWYEQAVKRLVDSASRINWALATDLAKVEGPERERAWAQAFEGIVALQGLEVEAELYASNSAYNAVREAVRDVTTVARSAWGMSGSKETPAAPVRLFEICFKMLYHAASRLAADVREHLDLNELDREWRLYDRQFRELQEEFASYTEDKEVPEAESPESKAGATE